jgi:hypothetical protein
LPSEGIAENFKIRAERVAAFTRQIIDANLDFCAAVKEAVGITPPLQWFTPGRTIAEIAKLPLQTPMADVLNHVKQYGAPKHLQAVPT